SRRCRGAGLPLMAYGYDQEGNLTTVTKPSGATTTFLYDDRRRVTAWTDSNHSRYDYAYDDRDRVVAEGGEAGHVQIALAYTEPDPDTGHRTTTLTTADGRTTRHRIDHRCRVIATTDPLGHTTRYSHDTRGNLLTRTDPLGRTTTHTYDHDGRLIGVIRPDGTELRITRGPFGLPAEVVGPDGARTTYAYDERGNRTTVTDPAGHATHYTYDNAGRLTSVTDALGATTTVRCDAAGLPVEVTDPSGATTRLERGLHGRAVRITDPTSGVTRLVWDADGNLARRVEPDGATTSWTYDGEGNRLTHTDPVGGVTRFKYTHFDLLAAHTYPDGSRYEFEHDAALRLIKVTNPLGLVWSYTYDAAGRLSTETDFDGHTLTYRRDATGQLTARVDALGGTISLTRDELSRVIRKTVGEQATTYTYDAAGRLVHAAGPGTELLRRYDRRGHLKTELVDGRALEHVYDAVGRRIRRTTPTGHVTTYTYDEAGRADRLTTGGHHIVFGYDAAGRELSRAFDDGFTVSSAWDEAGRLVAQHLTAGNRSLNSRTYSYRADGHLTTLTDRLSGTRTFDLDPLGRVTAVTADGWRERYAYDATGNQTFASWPASHPGHEATGPRTYDGITITRAGKVRYERDALGRVTLRRHSRLSSEPDTWRFVWDTENRLTSVVTPDGTRWRYHYDPLGRRTAKQRMAADGETVVEDIRFTWDGAALCEQTTVSPEVLNPVILTWDHRGLAPLAQTERILSSGVDQEEIDRRFFAIATDLVGTPVELVDEHGGIAWRTRNTLWGKTAWARASTAYTPLRFPGQYYDPETGLHYNVFRHYDPATARYLTADPLGLEPAPNPATYVTNPHAWTDPLGLSPYPTRIENGGWDVRGKNPLDIVPGDAEMRILTPDPNGGAQKGVEYKWEDPETGNKVRLRVHDKDGTAPPGSNAANGDIYRISIGGKYQDEAGNLYHRQVHNPNSPHYNSDAAHATHIPWPAEFPLPY
ncbi:polymorphic toxin type 30 domain-containing protein, partial [Streptomyces prasinus]|uniref:polymorphic toxin type 30 domain-containing protein n=1 Tax=Streptomyces prasinus TaxID=67345 RepID=UPI000AE04270